MPTTPKERQPAHVVLVDRLLRACETAIRPFQPGEEDHEGLVRGGRIDHVVWATGLLAQIIIPQHAVAEVRRRIAAIRDSLDANTEAKRTFGNEIRFIVSDLDVLLSLLPHEADVPATA